MPIQAPQWTDFRLCPVCQNEYNPTQKPPISLGCGHSICQSCLFQLSKQQCPFDQAEIQIEIKKLPINYALLSLVGGKIVDDVEVDVPEVKQHKKEFNTAKKAIEVLAQTLQNIVISNNSTNNNNYTTGNGVLTRPMQRKLVTLIHTQLAEQEGRSRALRAARSIGERAVKELILMHQNPQTLSTALWAAVRQRGCQFLGPAMQEAVLRLIVLSLEDGISLSRKVLVLYVVQKLETQFTQASKTSIGHVVQLLYRASCFKVTKRESDSSLLQLQEKYRTYSALRKEHDAQIVQIAMEAGLHISPEQWSALLYGDDDHKSHMQSIIDKLQSPASFASSIQELIIALQRTSDPHNLQSLRQHLDKLSAIDPSPEAVLDSWKDLEECTQSLSTVVAGLQAFSKEYASRNKGNLEGAQMIHSKYRTSMCRDILNKSSCPRGSNCNFAHTEEELDKYRKRRNISNSRPPMVHNNNMNGMAPYPNSRAGSSSSPDSCIATDLDEDLSNKEANKVNQVPNMTSINDAITFQQQSITGMAVPNHRMAGQMYLDQEPPPLPPHQHNVVAPMKNLNMNGYNQHYPPSMPPPQQQPQPQMPKKTEQMIKLPPGYNGNIPLPMGQQQQPQGNLQPQRQAPSIYHQMTTYSQPSFYDMRDGATIGQPPQPHQIFLQRNQQAYMTNDPIYHSQPVGQYVPYQQSMDFQYFSGHSFNGHGAFTMRTAVARGGSANDHSDLLKTPSTSNELRSLSISVKDEEWSKLPSSTNPSSNNNKGSNSFDAYIDSGRGSSNGYHSSDAFSPLSTNSSLGSRGSPPTMNADSDSSKMFGGGIWSKTGWKIGHSDGWDALLDSGNRLSDTDDRNTSNESLGKSSDHQSTTLDDERSYSYLKDLSRSSNDMLNNNNNNSKSTNQNLIGLLSPSLTRRPPPGFDLI